MYKFIVCGIFKNESHILQEWIEHYLFHGADHIFLVNDNSTDDYMDIIQQYSNKVTLYHNDIGYVGVGRQVIIINKYFKKLLELSEWMSILDLDEFLYSPIDINLKNVIDKYQHYNMIIAEWYYFGSNGHIEQPKCVVESFTKRRYKDINDNHAYKCIVKCKYVNRLYIHRCFDLEPFIYLKLDNNHNCDFIVNHYNIQSFNWFMKVKHTRGDCDNYIETTGFSRNEEYFRKHDINDITDTKLYEQNQDLIMLLNN